MRVSLNVALEMFRGDTASLSDDVFMVAWMALPFLFEPAAKDL
jgi:hypothetical protein